MQTPIHTLALALIASLGAGGCVFVIDDDDPVDVRYSYAPCVSNLDCGGATPECLAVTIAYDTRTVSDNMCSVVCSGDFQCPFGGGCYEVSGSGVSICYERCTDSFDCSPGWECTDTVGGALFDAICLPS